jgi:hypothetical protein
MPSVPPQSNQYNEGHNDRAAEYFGGDEKKKEKKEKSGGIGALGGAAAGLAIGGIAGAIIAHEMSKYWCFIDGIPAVADTTSQPKTRTPMMMRRRLLVLRLLQPLVAMMVLVMAATTQVTSLVSTITHPCLMRLVPGLLYPAATVRA